MTAFPNPTRDRVHLKFDQIHSGDIHIEIANLDGRRLIERDYWLRAGSETFEMDVSQLPQGLYIVMAKNQGKQEFSRLIIE